MTDTIPFTVVAGIPYVVDVDDLDTQGADAEVQLNGTSLMRPGSAAHDSASRHVNRVLLLADDNTLVVRLVGKPGSLLRVAIWRFRAVTLDAVTLPAQSSVQLDGPAVSFTSTITNHTNAALSDVAVQAWLVQPFARRAASGQVISCGAAFGVLPPGTCVRVGDGIAARNTSGGSGILLPGNAQAVIQVVALTGAGVLDSLVVPVVITPPPGPAVLGVSVTPGSVLLKPGDHATLTANVQVVGGAPTTVAWSTRNAAVAVVSASGVVTGVAPPLASSPYVRIVATSTADPTKSDSAQVAVVDWQIIKPDLPTTVSTGAATPASSPLSVVIWAAACSLSPTSGAPFSSVEFSASPNGMPVVLGSVTSLFVIFQGTRCIVWPFTWTPGSAFGVGPQKIYATGITDAGARVTTLANTNITTVTP